MFKKIIIAVLILLVLGLYFFPSTTKDIVDSTAHVVKDTTSKAYNQLKNDEKVQDNVEKIKENVKSKLNNS